MESIFSKSNYFITKERSIISFCYIVEILLNFINVFFLNIYKLCLAFFTIEFIYYKFSVYINTIIFIELALIVLIWLMDVYLNREDSHFFVLLESTNEKFDTYLSDKIINKYPSILLIPQIVYTILIVSFLMILIPKMVMWFFPLLVLSYYSALSIFIASILLLDIFFSIIEIIIIYNDMIGG